MNMLVKRMEDRTDTFQLYVEFSLVREESGVGTMVCQCGKELWNAG